MIDVATGDPRPVVPAGQRAVDRIHTRWVGVVLWMRGNELAEKVVLRPVGQATDANPDAGEVRR